MSILSEIAQEEYEMEMTPMIDVVFLLLIFFLLTIKFKILEGKLSAYLPKDVGVNSSEAEPKEKVEITIHVKKQGSKVYASEPDEGTPWGGEIDRRFEFVGRDLEYQIGPRKTKDLKQITTWMTEFFKKDPESPVTIDCRPGTVYGDMVPVLDAAVEANFTSITFVGEYKNAKK
jgi:biopolymer transport protein ExbD